MRALCVCFVCVSIWAVEQPRIGFVCNSQGRVHPIEGLAGSFIAGESVAEASEAFASNGVISVRKTKRTLELWDAAGAVLGSYPIEPGRIVIGLDQATAVVYRKSELWTLTASGLKVLPVNLSGDEVVAVGVGRLAVRHSDGTMAILRMTGSDVIESRTVDPASFLLFGGDGALVTSTGSSVRVLLADGTVWTTEVAVQSMRQMGAGWIHLSSGSKDFALLIRVGADPILYQLPRFLEDR